ncbi:glycosyltransferase family 4 protein [Georgenia satyanarayanai]|uniref:glycosyltransferase family 4 protein n=1 Tax=Georgenia satyanarayanai TaxID=860221 RepID=UPI00126589A0|nr:glycosyltransferase family 4 protein [Georgenia satyanarayanai]
MPGDTGARRRIVVAHPSPDVYGSDRQLAESVQGLVEHGWLVTVVLPADGPLRPLLEARGAEVRIREFPVLRRALLRPRALLGLVLGAPAAVGRLRSLLRRSGACAVYVNTLTIPAWVLAARTAGLPVICHSHEAERVSRPLQLALTVPLLLARLVIANSESTREVLTQAVPRLVGRAVVVPNGVPDVGPPAPLRTRSPGEELRLALVSRLSPRKGIHVAVEAVALLRARGHLATLDVCGSTFPGYEWYERALADQVGDRGVADAVTFHGYVDPTRPLLERADVVVVPSFGESFGNVAVEGMLAGRPVVASGVQGLAEVVEHGRTGVLVRPGSAPALAAAVAALAEDPALAARLAAAGRHRASTRFGVDEYRARIAALAGQVAAAAPRTDAVSAASRPGEVAEPG